MDNTDPIVQHFDYGTDAFNADQESETFDQAHAVTTCTACSRPIGQYHNLPGTARMWFTAEGWNLCPAHPTSNHHMPDGATDLNGDLP